jgi:hypothetical protein
MKKNSLYILAISIIFFQYGCSAWPTEKNVSEVTFCIVNQQNLRVKNYEFTLFLIDDNNVYLEIKTYRTDGTGCHLVKFDGAFPTNPDSNRLAIRLRSGNIVKEQTFLGSQLNGEKTIEIAIDYK